MDLKINNELLLLFQLVKKSRAEHVRDMTRNLCYIVFFLTFTILYISYFLFNSFEGCILLIKHHFRYKFSRYEYFYSHVFEKYFREYIIPAFCLRSILTIFFSGGGISYIHNTCQRVKTYNIVFFTKVVFLFRRWR